MTVRGEAATPSDFDRGMEAYRRGDYPNAVRWLKRAAAHAPGPATLFFLGTSLLMTDDAASAARSLRAAVDLGESPYQQQAEVFLSKALIRIGDLDGAEREADRASRLGGDRAADAHDLASALRAARGGSR